MAGQYELPKNNSNNSRSRCVRLVTGTGDSQAVPHTTLEGKCGNRDVDLGVGTRGEVRWLARWRWVVGVGGERKMSEG